MLYPDNNMWYERFMWFYTVFFAGHVTKRKISVPAKYKIYWDLEMPMEYYEESFLDFEDYLNVTGQMKKASADDPHANSKYVLESFRKYEKFQKHEDRKEWRKYQRSLRQQQLKPSKTTTCTQSAANEAESKVQYSENILHMKFVYLVYV